MTAPNDTALAAAAYVQLGWKVIQLHDVRTGACSCDKGRYCDDSAGKHPIAKAWQLNYLSDVPSVYAAWAARPQANIGIVTGPPSGIWVLDIDPKHGGLESLSALEMTHGALPKTYTIRTGSGGLHFYFTLAGIDFDLTNTMGRAGGRLPVGMDVRGRGGFVVAPPSVSGHGAYAAMADPDRPYLVGPLAHAPTWLSEMQRPKVYAAPAAPAAGVFREGHGYALAAVRAELEVLASALPGTRNETAFRVGCRLYELALAPWSGLEVEQVESAFMSACARANIDGKFLDGEAWSVWLHVQRHVTQPAVLPEPRHLGTLTGWSPPSDFDRAGQDPASPFTIPRQYQTLTEVARKSINGPAEQVEYLDPFEIEVRRLMGQLMAREEAGRRIRMASSAKSPILIMDREAQAAMPRMQPLISGWLGRGQAARIYGPPGAGKSFVAVEMAACVAQGIPWHGRPVVQGEVVYFAVEDAEGIALRLRAWERHRQVEHRVHVVSTPVQMNVETVRRVTQALEAYFDDRRLALIVLDTQAMVTVGMDENSVADMGVFVEAIKLLVAQTGATVLTVHHSGVRGGRARGSTSVLGAMDVELEASLNGTTLALSAVKQKNVAKPPPIMATLNTVDMGETDIFGNPVTSCVLIAAEDVTGPFVSPAGPGLTSLQKRALAIATVLTETEATGETYSRVRTRAAAITDFGRTSASVTSTFSKAWAFLVERGRVAKAVGREAYYFIEIEGLDRLAANPEKSVMGGPEVYTGE